MVRKVKEHEYAVKRSEILDAAQRLVYTRGYQQMTIQDILSEMQISKGAFYHYFDSKQALLEALTGRLIDEGENLLLPIVENPTLSALQKFRRYFEDASRWKTEQKDYLLAILRVWYADDNALVRQKVFDTSVKRFAPYLARLIQQGIQEGTMNTPFPDQAGEMILTISQGLGDGFSRLLLQTEREPVSRGQVEDMTAAYTDGLERVLGTPRGSLCLMDAEILEAWFPSQEPAAPNPGVEAAERTLLTES